MKPAALATLLLTLVTVPAIGHAVEATWFGPAVQVAQLSAEERRALRERWERSAPEERDVMRRQFQDRLQTPTVDPRRMPETMRMPGFAPRDGSRFGTGYERRRDSDPRDDEYTDPRSGRDDSDYRRRDDRRR